MMDKPKFKRGEIVKALHDIRGIKAGMKYEVTVDSGGAFVGLKGETGLFPAEEFESWKKPLDVIVITSDGDNATARILKDKTVVNQVKLKRNKDDRNDLKKLAAYAVQKLLPDDGNVIDVHKAGYYGSVCVVNSTRVALKNGRILEVYGGKCVNPPFECSYEMGRVNFKTFADLKNWANAYGCDVVELHRN